jgi:hypothetical protein
LGALALGNGQETRAGGEKTVKILRAILNTIVDVVMLPFRAIGRLLGAGESTARGGGRRRR